MLRGLRLFCLPSLPTLPSNAGQTVVTLTVDAEDGHSIASSLGSLSVCPGFVVLVSSKLTRLAGFVLCDLSK
jgi:hypothetical protein